MKILSFAASNSPQSINRQLLEYAHTLVKGNCVDNFVDNLDIELLDINEFEMPIYHPERETQTGVPPQAQHFFNKIGQADVLLISFAEHNGFVTSAWKNIFDWMSRINSKVWQGKPMVILAASPGPRAGANVLASQAMLAPHLGGEIRAQHGVGKWHEVWDESQGALRSKADIEALQAALAKLFVTTQS